MEYSQLIQGEIRANEEYLASLAGWVSRQLATLLEMDRLATETGLEIDNLRTPYLNGLREEVAADSDAPVGNEETLEKIWRLQAYQLQLCKEKIEGGKQCLAQVLHAKQLIAESRAAIWKETSAKQLENTGSIELWRVRNSTRNSVRSCTSVQDPTTSSAAPSDVVSETTAAGVRSTSTPAFPSRGPTHIDPNE